MIQNCNCERCEVCDDAAAACRYAELVGWAWGYTKATTTQFVDKSDTTRKTATIRHNRNRTVSKKTEQQKNGKITLGKLPFVFLFGVPLPILPTHRNFLVKQRLQIPLQHAKFFAVCRLSRKFQNVHRALFWRATNVILRPCVSSVWTKYWQCSGR